MSSPFVLSAVPGLSSYPDGKITIREIVFTHTTICYYT